MREINFGGEPIKRVKHNLFMTGFLLELKRKAHSSQSVGGM